MKKGIFLTILMVLIFFGVVVYKNYFNQSNPDLIAGLILSQIPEKEKSEIRESTPALQLLGSAQISYAGSSVDRAHNIELGISKINGTVVGRGEEFSFTQVLGVVSAEEGYRDEKSFIKGEVVYGSGGGLCQVSTTLFQSVLDSGLPVTERYNHTYTVPYYKIGLDATYSNPGPDLKFINDTNSFIKIVGRTENQKAVFEIYGLPDGRLASVSEPEIYNRSKIPSVLYFYDATLPLGTEKCEQRSQSGYTTKVSYNVIYPDNSNKEQIFYSIYRPLARVCNTNKPEHYPFAILR